MVPVIDRLATLLYRLSWDGTVRRLRISNLELLAANGRLRAEREVLLDRVARLEHDLERRARAGQAVIR